MKILYYPYDSWANKYIDLSKKSIELTGAEIKPLQINVKGFFQNKDADIAIFNWYESLYCKNSILPLLKEIIKRKLIVHFLRMQGMTIIQTFHNKKPHNIEGKHEKLQLEFVRWTYRHADKIIVLTEDSKKYLEKYINKSQVQMKAVYIPHPNYIGVYPVSYEKRLHGLSSSKMKILFVGLISPYKNVDLIIKVAQELSHLDIVFNIYGKCNDDHFAKYLCEKSKELNNVKVNLGFVSDEELSSLVIENDILMLPYDMDSSMNSGTVYLAFSNKRTVICPRISTIVDFGDKDIYTYDYFSKEEHFKNLKQATERAYEDWKDNNTLFCKKREHVFEKVSTSNSLDCLASRYDELFKETSKVK